MLEVHPPGEIPSGVLLLCAVNESECAAQLVPPVIEFVVTPGIYTSAAGAGACEQNCQSNMSWFSHAAPVSAVNPTHPSPQLSTPGLKPGTGILFSRRTLSSLTVMFVPSYVMCAS